MVLELLKFHHTEHYRRLKGRHPAPLQEATPDQLREVVYSERESWTRETLLKQQMLCDVVSKQHPKVTIAAEDNNICDFVPLENPAKSEDWIIRLNPDQSRPKHV
jgi:hypothetical protein